MTQKQRSRARKRIRHRDGGACCWCGRTMVFDKPSSPLFATIEHLRPVSRGGNDRSSNLALACKQCNTMRGNAKTGGWAPRRIA